MSRFYLLFIFSLFILSSPLSAQQDTTRPAGDSVINRQLTDSIRPPVQAVNWADSVSRQPVVVDSGWRFDNSAPLYVQVLKRHPYFGFGAPLSIPAVSDLKLFDGKEILFYSLLALLMLFAFLRQAFGKYFNDLFRLFFRTTLKQRQIREQLIQTPLPSLLLNTFFVITGGMYIDLLLLHYNLVEEADFWLFFFYCCVGLSVIYFIKFIGLKVMGWIFGIQDAANSYIFIVFIINKVIGVFLLPFVILLSFLDGQAYQAVLVLSWIGVAGLYLYRFILTWAAIHNQVRFNIFHFFLYLCAFEIAPLLLIYKLLLVFFQ